jgi:diguanylate cyclase (GGDEF)-like protein/PAS domain S-box-containing protein
MHATPFHPNTTATIAIAAAAAAAAERSAAELAHRRFELIVEHSTDVISILGRGGEWLYSSPAGTRLLGHPQDRNPENGIFSYVHPEDSAFALRSLQEVIDGSRSPQEPVVFRVRNVAGEWRHFETLGVNLLDDPVIQGVLIISRDVTDRHQLTELLVHAAMHDPLTDLLNRSAIAEQIDAALARSSRTKTNVAACFIDLDHFKPVNDRYGHPVGDQVLVEVANRLRAQVRAGDSVARVGGDEFIVLCESFVDTADAARIAERIAVSLNEPYRCDVGLIECGASIGVASARPGEAQTQLLARADEALYRAKAAGRRCVSFEDSLPAPRAAHDATH